MGRHKTSGELEIFVKYGEKRKQQFFKIKRVCKRYPTLEEVEHYMNRYGDRFFAHIFCIHFQSEQGLDKIKGVANANRGHNSRNKRSPRKTR